jgi:hypothetical protein
MDLEGDQGYQAKKRFILLMDESIERLLLRVMLLYNVHVLSFSIFWNIRHFIVRPNATHLEHFLILFHWSNNLIT